MNMNPRDKDAPIEWVGTLSLGFIGVLLSGAAGLEFLSNTVRVPRWILWAAVILPTGDLLAWLRSFIPDTPENNRRNSGGN